MSLMIGLSPLVDDNQVPAPRSAHTRPFLIASTRSKITLVKVVFECGLRSKIFHSSNESRNIHKKRRRRREEIRKKNIKNRYRFEPKRYAVPSVPYLIDCASTRMWSSGAAIDRVHFLSLRWLYLEFQHL